MKTRKAIAAGAAGCALVLAGMTGGGTASAAAAGQPGLHTLERAVVSGQTFGIDGRTYTARPMTAAHWTPADQRLCHGMATFPRTHASVPTVRELAYDSTYANGWLAQDSAALVAYALADRGYGPQLRQVNRDCA